MRGRAAWRTACQARSMSSKLARARPAIRGTADLLGHSLDRLEVAVGSDGEAGLNHVHAQAVELARHAQLFVQPHAAPWRLLAVT